MSNSLDEQLIADWDSALNAKHERDFEVAFGALRPWAVRKIFFLGVSNKDDAADIAQDVIARFYPKSLVEKMTGKQAIRIMVGITKNVIKAYQNKKHTLPLDTPFSKDNSLTFKDRLPDDQPDPEAALIAKEEAEQYEKIKEKTICIKKDKIHTALTNIESEYLSLKNTSLKRQTLESFCKYIRNCLARCHNILELRIAIVSFKEKKHLLPEVSSFLLKQCGLKNKKAVINRISNVHHLVTNSGLKYFDGPTFDLATKVDNLRTAAWQELQGKENRRNRESVFKLCDWFTKEIETATQKDENAYIEMGEVLAKVETQKTLDPELSAFLQKELKMNQNAIKQRVNRHILKNPTVMSLFGGKNNDN